MIPTRELTCAITMQAVRDYFAKDVTPKKRQTILKELRAPWMDFITDGMSTVVAEQLEKKPKEIAARLRRNKELED